MKAVLLTMKCKSMILTNILPSFLTDLVSFCVSRSLLDPVNLGGLDPTRSTVSERLGLGGRSLETKEPGVKVQKIMRFGVENEYEDDAEDQEPYSPKLMAGPVHLKPGPDAGNDAGEEDEEPEVEGMNHCRRLLW